MHALPLSRLLHSTSECADGSDEDPTLCGTEQEGCLAEEFECTNGDCVPANATCNGVADCGDASDERGCPAPAAVDAGLYRVVTCANSAQERNTLRSFLGRVPVSP